MQKTSHRFPLALLVLLLALIPASGFAQTFRGGINGAVTDSSGAAVPNASVTATDVDTAAKMASTTSSGGEFLFQDLPLGKYSVVVTAQGFSTIKVDNVTVSAGVIYTLPVKLAVSASSETVEVNAAAIALDTTTATQTTVLDAKTVADIPLNGRDFTQLIGLTPGFAGYVGGGFASLNGTRANQINWQIDGVDNNDLWHNIPAVNQGGVSGIAGIVLPIDAVDQFSAQTQAGPEGGRNPGGTVNLTLRSGTNQIHGTAYYFNRNELFGAKSPLLDTKQKVRNYNAGFSAGGPIFHDKLFWFTTFEHQRFVIGQSGKQTEPNAGWQAQAQAILAAKNIAPLPVMQAVLNKLWAGGNLSSTDTTLSNFHSPAPEFGFSYNGLGKVDWSITPKDNLSVHWFFGQGNQVAPLGGGQLPDYYEVAPIHVQNIAILYNRSITPHISNQVLAGVNYFNQLFNDSNTAFNVQSLGLNTGASFTNAPKIAIQGFDKVGLTPPEGRNDITGHLTDQISWIRGKHEFRFGGEFRQAQLDEFYHRNAVGNFTFDGTRVGGAGLAGSLADFLAGQPSKAVITVGNPERQVFVNTFFVNAGDAWQASSRMNVNYGVRYDYEGPLHNGNQDLSVFRPALINSGGLAVQGNTVDSLYQHYWTSFSPRVGVSYQAAPRTVLRAGYGWYFDLPNLNPFLDNRPGNSAPNGVEGNPAGPNPVATISAANGKAQIVPGVNIFGGVTPTCSTANPCGIFSVASSFRPSYNENYSLNIEQSIAPNVIAQVGYVGSQGRHLLSILNINAPLPGSLRAANQTLQSSRPYFAQYPTYGDINQIESIGTSNYNSLQMQLRVQNYHRVTVSGAYTFSHNLDEVTAYRGSLPQDSRNFKGDYGNSDYDTRNTFVGYLSYQVPGSSRLRALTNGWQVNSLLSFHGGQPFSVAASGDISGTAQGTDRANQIAPIRTGFQGQKPNAQWIDLNSFADPAPGTFGTSRRNQYFGPGYSDVDLSVFKETKIRERASIQFRAEMFNLFNRANYAPPGGGSVNPAGGNIAVGGDASLNDTIGDYNGAPGIGAGEPFNTQFGAKIVF